MPSQFKIVAGAGTTCTNGSTVAGNGGTCTIAIDFAPTSVNLFFVVLPFPWMQTATLNLSGAPTNPSIHLMGQAVNPSATLAGTTAFASQAVGTTSLAHTFTYANTGIGPITVSSVNKTGSNLADYTIASDSCIVAGVGVTLQANATCQILVTFTPAALGTRRATVTVVDAAGGASNQAVNLTGNMP